MSGTSGKASNQSAHAPGKPPVVVTWKTEKSAQGQTLLAGDQIDSWLCLGCPCTRTDEPIMTQEKEIKAIQRESPSTKEVASSPKSLRQGLRTFSCPVHLDVQNPGVQRRQSGGEYGWPSMWSWSPPPRSEVSVPHVTEQLLASYRLILLFGDAGFYVAVMTDQCEWRNFLCAGSLSMRNRVPSSQGANLPLDAAQKTFLIDKDYHSSGRQLSLLKPC